MNEILYFRFLFVTFKSLIFLFGNWGKDKHKIYEMKQRRWLLLAIRCIACNFTFNRVFFILALSFSLIGVTEFNLKVPDEDEVTI